MQDIIQDKLKEIEVKENIRILHAVESGSRAWGFSSIDSDYDVRFIYIRKIEDYLKLNKTRDVIEWQLDEVYDINGWDLIKALRLVHNANPTFFEWAHSPIIYKTTDDFMKIYEVTKEFFSIRKALYHYFNTAKMNYQLICEKDQVKLKRYFYVLRPLLACLWIMEFNTIPPILFSELCDKMLDVEVKHIVQKYLLQKTQHPESHLIEHNKTLEKYIEIKLEEINCAIKNYPDLKQNWDNLNNLFVEILNSQEN